MLTCLSLKAQDRVFYLDGTSKLCKVLDVNSEHIKIADEQSPESIIARAYIMMIEYKNGYVDIFNVPTEDSELGGKQENEEVIKPLKASQFKHSYASINTMGLCNADISGTYEYMPNTIPLTFGVMGAYNFNIRGSIQNANISVLDNGKKNYDLGFTINYFPASGDEGAEKISIGLMFKYTDFNYTTTHIDSTGSAGSRIPVTTYQRHNGHQFSTLGTASYHLNFKNGFFMRGIVGLGFFKLERSYRDAYNEVSNRDQKPGQAYIDHQYLAKGYLALNIGFNF